MKKAIQLAEIIEHFDEFDEALPLEQMKDVSCELRRLQAEIDRLNDLLTEIGNKSHDASTGPALPDTLWEIRAMAYQQ